MKLNQNGLIFTIMTFFMILAVLSLNAAIKDSYRESQDIVEIAALASVQNKFRNIERQIIDLDKKNKPKEINERFLPFTYDLNKDMNYLIIQQQLPEKAITLQGFFDVINGLEVFLEDTNRENAFDGLAVDINTLKNSQWGGTDSEEHFLIEPFCYEYAIKGQNEALFRKSGSEKCSGEFQNSYVKRFDLNIMIESSNEDFNILTCDGQASCPQEAYNPNHPQGFPYYRIEIDDANCNNCALGQKVVSSHFNPNSDFNVMVGCVGSNCVSDAIIISHSGLDFNVFHESDYRLNISAKTMFSENIGQFYFLDFNVSVKHFNAEISKTNT